MARCGQAVLLGLIPPVQAAVCLNTNVSGQNTPKLADPNKISSMPVEPTRGGTPTIGAPNYVLNVTNS